MNREKFEKIVVEGIEAIPEKFLRKLDNIAIVIEDNPTPEQKKKLKIGRDCALFGLYEGVPHTRRGSGYFGVLPDKITIFMEPILEMSASEEKAKEIVRDTVWHEIAHHFGMDELRVRRVEAIRGRRTF